MGDPRPGGVSAGQPVPRPLGRGDRIGSVDPQVRRSAFLELVGLWLATLLLIRGVVFLQRGLALPDLVLAAVPLLFIYMPVALCRLRKVDSWSYHLSIPAFRDWVSWRLALSLNLRVCGVLVLPWLLAYHLWQTQLFGLSPGHGWPDALLTLVAYQVFFVAIPEEFFYRGYVQTRLNEVFARRFLVFGTPMGWGAVIASLFFAFGHSLVEVQWWHFATFFPGLVFAWMRERTNGVVAGAFFHAACNVAVVCMDSWYGLR